jgi:hypothetical protein
MVQVCPPLVVRSSAPPQVQDSPVRRLRNTMVAVVPDLKAAGSGAILVNLVRRRG